MDMRDDRRNNRNTPNNLGSPSSATANYSVIQTPNVTGDPGGTTPRGPERDLEAARPEPTNPTVIQRTVATLGSPLTRGVLPAMTNRKDPALLKQTTRTVILGCVKTESQISEPMTVQGKRDQIYESVGGPESKKIKPAVSGERITELENGRASANLMAALRDLSKVNSDAMVTRLQHNTELLNALKPRNDNERNAEGNTERAADENTLHQLINSSELTGAAFQRSAEQPTQRGYEQRQIDTVARTPEAYIEQGIKTLNLYSEGVKLQASIEQVAATNPEPAELAAQIETTEAALAEFESQYEAFVKDLRGAETGIGEHMSTIAAVANLATTPADREKKHAQLMTKVVAERRIDKAIDAISNEADKAEIEGIIKTLTAQKPAAKDHQQFTELVKRLTGENDGFASNQSAKQFLEALADMKASPLDEVLRARTDCYREKPWAPADQGSDSLDEALAAQQMDMEKIHAELTSIAIHVRAAVKTGKLQEKLAELFKTDAQDVHTLAVVDSVKESFGKLIDRTPGEPVDPQDKLNIKLAKCILDHGAGVRGLASALKYTQENYVDNLEANSPDMKQMLRSGSTGASYDPVEQRANALARVAALHASLRALDAKYEQAVPQGENPIDHAIKQAESVLKQEGHPADKLELVKQRLFLLENYVRKGPDDDARTLLRQLADNDPRCGTDAVIAENRSFTGNIGGTFGVKIARAVKIGVSTDGSRTTQGPTDSRVLPPTSNAVPNSLVLVESSAYSMKSVVKLNTTVEKNTRKESLSLGLNFGGPIDYSASYGTSNGFESMTIEKAEPGIVCIVHKAPVLDGTRSNAKLTAATHLAINDNVNRVFFAPPKELRSADTLQTTGIDGWDNLRWFFAATDRATLEPIIERKEVTVTESFTQSYSPIGGSMSQSIPENHTFHGVTGERAGLSSDYNLKHTYREECLETATLKKKTLSDTFSDNRSAGAGLSARVGAALTVFDSEPPGYSGALRLTTGIDVLKLSKGIEYAREYKESYQREVFDQFGNEIPSLVRDSKTSTDGRLLVNNLVKDLGLLRATVSQRIDKSETMHPVEEETLSKLLCLSTLASHYRNAGAFTNEPRPPNDNLTINVTAALTPAAAARVAVEKMNKDKKAREDVLKNSLNYSTIGAAGGFKNQDTSSTEFLINSWSKRSTSSAQSAGYPSGTDMLDETTAAALATMLAKPENHDIRAALQTVGMDRPVELLQQYEALKASTPAPAAIDGGATPPA